MKSKLNVLGVLLVSTMVFFACSKDEDKPTPQPTEKVVKFADANFKKALLENTELNTNKDNEIQEKEALAFTGKINVSGKGLTNLTDLQFFPSIKELDCSNNNLTTLNLSKNTKLTAVYCQHNKIKGVGTTTATKGQTDENTIWTLSANTELKILDCSYNQLVNIDLSKNTKLENVDCSHNIELVSLNIANGNNAILKILNATNTPKLKTILVDEDKAQNPPKEWKKDESTNYNNQNVIANPYIEFTTNQNEIRLTINANDEDKANIWIDLHKNGVRDSGEEVTTFNEAVSYVVNKQTVRVYGKITVFNCYSGGLTFLTIDNNPELIELECGNNSLKSLNITNNSKLQELRCENNQLESLDVSKNPELTLLWCKRNKLKNLNIENNSKLNNVKCGNNQLSNLNINNNTKLKELECGGNRLNSLDVSKNTELEYLDFWGNRLNSLDVSKNTELECLYCGNNQLTELNVSNNTTLTNLGCSDNQLTELNVGNNTALTNLGCSNNQLSNLNVNNNTKLKSLVCESNQLKRLNVDNNIKLTRLFCSGNQLSALDISNNVNLKTLYCNDNQLTKLDVSKCSKLGIGKDDWGNPNIFKCRNNSNLTCIQVSQEQLDRVKDKVFWWKDDTATYSTNCGN